MITDRTNHFQSCIGGEIHSPNSRFLLGLAHPQVPPKLRFCMSTAINGQRTILVVDDFDDTRLLLRTWLERRGFRVVEAENGIQAINQAETESPDLIIMDMQMPQLDGLSATRQIRNLKSMNSVPIVAVSAYGADQFREQALAAGCNEYVSTPFEPATLEGIIRDLVHT
jgi:two-component system, cell cycle response regulator DivK